jgi:hypothetical protein
MGDTEKAGIIQKAGKADFLFLKLEENKCSSFSFIYWTLQLYEE